jgi:DamX protein
VAAPDSALPATPASNSPATERQTAPHHPVADIAAAETQADVDRQRLAQGPTTLAQATASAKVEAPHREDWLLNQPATLYSLQLLGSRNEKAVLKFIEEYRLELSDTAYYKGSFKETEWFVLLYGLYPSREAAISARDTLPKPLRKSKPWPRSLESVQSAIREVER